MICQGIREIRAIRGQILKKELHVAALLLFVLGSSLFSVE
jgi:hypothetical protein